MTNFTAGQTCTVTYSFSPTRPGTRYGAVVVRSRAGTTLGTSYLYGTATGPQVTFLPAAGPTVLPLGGGFTYPVGIAVDAGDAVYVADQKANVVSKIPAGCTSASCVTPVGGWL